MMYSVERDRFKRLKNATIICEDSLELTAIQTAVRSKIDEYESKKWDVDEELRVYYDAMKRFIGKIDREIEDAC